MANKKKKAKKMAAAATPDSTTTAVATPKAAPVTATTPKKGKATPSRKNPNNTKVGKDGKPKKTAKEFFQGIGTGIKSIVSELKKVTWPKFNDALKNTGIVLVVCLIFLVVCLGIDSGLSALIKLAK
jgi:preprotein translocase SecE subunit